MGMFFIFAGSIGLLVAFTALIVAIVRKHPKKLWLVAAACCLALIVVGLLMPKTAPVISSSAGTAWMVAGIIFMLVGFLAAVILFFTKRKYVPMSLLAIPLGFIIAGGSGILSYDYLNPPVVSASEPAAVSAAQAESYSSSAVPASVSSASESSTSSAASIPESSIAESISSEKTASESASVSSDASSSASSLTDTQKAEIIELDAKIFSIVLQSENITMALQQGVGQLTTGEASLLTLFDASKNAKALQLDLYSALDDLSDKTNSSYITACQKYVSNARSVADDLVKYIDKNKISYLSDAKERLTGSESLVRKIIVERTKYLLSMGLSDQEVQALLTSDAK